MKIKRMTKLCGERRQNYDPSCPTAFDDIDVINQLDMDLLCLQMKVKVWEDEHELVLTDGKQEEEKMQKVIEQLEQLGSKYVDREVVQVPFSSAPEPISEVTIVTIRNCNVSTYQRDISIHCG